jgi:hypothetical protein
MQDQPTWINTYCGHIEKGNHHERFRFKKSPSQEGSNQ